MGQGQFVEALRLALSFYQGKALAVHGLPEDIKERRAVTRAHIDDLLRAYADIAVLPTSTPSYEAGMSPEAALAADLQFYKGVVSLCTDYCLLLRAHDLLFVELYDRFNTCDLARTTFLELLEPLILADRLGALPATVMNAFVEHYQAKGALDTVQECILHLDVSNLDIHQVVIMCWTHSLHDAMIYVYNR